MIGFDSIEHFIASGLKDVVTAEKAVVSALTKVQSAEGTIEAITGLVPGYGTTGVAIERVSFAVLAMVITAAKAAENATSSDGLNVKFDQQTIEAVEAIIKSIPAQIAAAEASMLPSTIKK